jgi:hypothetical protein
MVESLTHIVLLRIVPYSQYNRNPSAPGFSNVMEMRSRVESYEISSGITWEIVPLPSSAYTPGKMKGLSGAGMEIV